MRLEVSTYDQTIHAGEWGLFGIWASAVKRNTVGQRCRRLHCIRHPLNQITWCRWITPNSTPVENRDMPHHSHFLLFSFELNNFTPTWSGTWGFQTQFMGHNWWRWIYNTEVKSKGSKGASLFKCFHRLSPGQKKKRPVLSFTLFSSVWIVGSRKGEDFTKRATDVTKREIMKKKRSKTALMSYTIGNH